LLVRLAALAALAASALALTAGAPTEIRPVAAQHEILGWCLADDLRISVEEGGDICRR
jgi:hypothetical protein